MRHPLRFFVGLDDVHFAAHFARVCISIRRLRKRRKPVPCREVFIDSGAFTELAKHGAYQHSPGEYACLLHRLAAEGVASISVAVAQDYMCEPAMLRRTGLDIPTHQRLTIERYDALLSALEAVFAAPLPFPVMPVLQGFEPSDYVIHLEDYGDRLVPGMWVGVGSVCKRQGDPQMIVEVLAAIHHARPDLRLHGFGVKRTALAHQGVRDLLYSADSMAWSYSARKQGRKAHDWREARRFVDVIEGFSERPFAPWQVPLPLIRSNA